MPVGDSLKRFASEVRGIVVDGVRESRRILSERQFNKTTKATAAHSLMVEFAKERLLGLPEVGYINLKGRHLFLLGEEWAVCFKKFDARMRCRGIATDQATAFMEQGQLPLDYGEGTRNPVNLVAGYQYTDEACTLFGVFVVCPITSRTNEWVMPLYDEPTTDAGQAVALFPVIPQGPLSAAAEVAPVLPKLRRSAEEEREETHGQ